MAFGDFLLALALALLPLPFWGTAFILAIPVGWWWWWGGSLGVVTKWGTHVVKVVNILLDQKSECATRVGGNYFFCRRLYPNPI